MTLELMNIRVDDSSLEALYADATKVICTIQKDWQPQNLEFKVYTDGITNRLVGVYPKDGDKRKQILLRVFGDNTDLFLDREYEKRNMKLLEPHGCGPKLYCSFSNGICYSFTPGVPLTTDTAITEPVYSAVAEHMAKLHSIKRPTWDKTSMLFAKMQRFLDLMPKDLSSCEKLKEAAAAGLDKAFFLKEKFSISPALESLSCQLVLCHNDLSPNNIIWQEDTKTVKFIDFEYSALNYQPFDIANHFCELAGLSSIDYSRYPSEEFQRKWLTKYLSHLPPTGRPIEWWLGAVAVMTLASHLFWTVWAFVQATNSDIDFDFAKYGLLRITEYKKRKEEFLERGEKGRFSLFTRTT